MGEVIVASKGKNKDTFIIKDEILSNFVKKQYNTGVIATTSYDFRAKVFGSEIEAKAFIDDNHLDGFVVVKKNK